MVPHTARLDRSGRLVLPAAIRGELELREGDEVVFLAGTSPGEVRLLPRRGALRQSQALVRAHIPAGRRLADELVRSRRREAAQETPSRPRRA
ncbi:MAG: AbrB/MazE/SpoVT family DNA-binding domain-containing protein [Solirubrobacteraceae bacterium]